VKRSVIIVSIALAAMVSAWANPQLFSNPRNYVAFYPPEKATVAAGKAGKVELLFRVTRGYHINSNMPHDRLLIPTLLELHAPAELPMKVEYPTGLDKTFEFSPEKMSVYDGDVTLKVQFAPPAGAKPGTHKLTGHLKYQACNDRACFPPNKVPVEFEVEIAKKN
jgi:DsbC/DsbD-like thiol-disulfide interchange protein